MINQRQKILKELRSLRTWRSLEQLADTVGEPATSVSAQLRALRRPEYGGYQIEKHWSRELREWQYRLGA